MEDLTASGSRFELAAGGDSRDGGEPECPSSRASSVDGIATSESSNVSDSAPTSNSTSRTSGGGYRSRVISSRRAGRVTGGSSSSRKIIREKDAEITQLKRQNQALQQQLDELRTTMAGASVAESADARS